MRYDRAAFVASLLIGVCAMLDANATDDPSAPIDVFAASEEDLIGVEDAATKYPQYREQNVLVTNSGAVVVVCQGRNKSNWSDRSGQDLVVKRSLDSGKTWSKGKLVVTHGLRSICPNAAVYDRETNRIHVLYNLFSWDYPTPPKHIKGEHGENDCSQFVVTSDDEGETWSEPRDISQMIGANGAVAVFGSGEGIQLRLGPNAGRLLIAGGDFYKGKKVLCYLSDDHGETWRRGGVLERPKEMAMASETKIAEMPDGSLVLNSRSYVVTGEKERLRTRAFSQDGGESWTPLVNDPALETVSCNGSLIAVEHKSGKDGAVLLCSLPVGPKRTHGTVYISFDSGKTWPRRRLVVESGFAYSSLMTLPDGMIGLFYETEGYRQIRLVRFSLDWLLATEDNDVKTTKQAFTIPLIDLAHDTERQVVIDREKGQYLGHPTTVLLEDNKTMICVYPKGHGKGGIVMKRSADAGLTWSHRLPTPESWMTSKEVPTLYRVVDDDGKKRLIMFSGLYPIRMSVSEDDGATFSELEPIGDFGGIVAMACLTSLTTGAGHYITMFHDDGRFIFDGSQRADPRVMTLFQTLSKDGGLTWAPPREITKSSNVHLCEPGIIRSPDGKQLAVLLRENRRVMNSHVIFSDDEGATWSEPRELPSSLTGDRHTLRYGHDGRLVATFRDRTPAGYDSPTEGDWVAWIGTYEDIAEGREGQYRVRVMDNQHKWDCAYPGLELLPDGTFITTTYGHWTKGEEPYVVSVRFTLDELDAMASGTSR